MYKVIHALFMYVRVVAAAFWKSKGRNGAGHRELVAGMDRVRIERKCIGLLP